MKSKTSLFLILIFTFIIPSIIHSAEVTRATAEQVAINLYTERNEMAPNDFEIVESFVETENAENIYYIFNFDKTGFVIVSAEDAAVPILGYVFKHNYSTENHPPQFDAMLNSYKDQILYIKNNDYKPSQETISEWNRLNVTSDEFLPDNTRAVAPLLSTTWNQGQYYNESCPADPASNPMTPGTPGNGYVWAGCTATATAQVMKYHAHPVTGEGSHAYTPTTNPGYGVQSVNFAAATYNWVSMPNNVTAVTPAVHTLLYHVGVGAEMDYGIYWSGAYIGGAVPASALSALQNHFKYDQSANYDQRNNYAATPSVWHSMLKTELDNNRPLVYDGYNSGGSDGHAFVIDGYQGVSNDQYHVNFGWGVSGYDGYYTLDALAPYLPTHDYRFFQAALFGVEPRRWEPLPDVSIDVSLLPYTGVDLDDYFNLTPPLYSYNVLTDLSAQEFGLTINGNNELYFTQNTTLTSNVNIDITIRAAYTGGPADDTFNLQITGVTSTSYDWGDAPDPPYPTTQFNMPIGANHTIVTGLQLGSLIDPDPDGQPDATATGDDLDGSNDDDGITFTSTIIPGGTANYTATVPVMCILNAWIDFDGNGYWGDPGEQIATNIVLNPGSNPLSFPVPASAVIGNTFARFRVNSLGGLTFTGSASDGEVEDYQVTIGEESSLKWEQEPDLTENGIDVYATADMYEMDPPIILADDFLCTDTGNITDIHIWGSWLNDMFPYGGQPDQVQFTLSLHADIPANESPTGYSMPGQTLWWRTFDPGDFDIEWYSQGDEGWLWPFHDDPFNYQFPGDTWCIKYNFYLDPEDYFYQEGTEIDPIVYWLDVQAVPQDPDMWDARFGWKTSEEHWNDNAVWTYGYEPYSGDWYELIYPLGHLYETMPIDLAFQITTEGGGPTDDYDFGDAPEGDGATAYPSLGVDGAFPTCINVGPVGSYIQHGFGDNWAWFGPQFDLETDGNAGLCPGCFPTYDDDECFNDGDAGLIMPESYTIDATNSVVPCVTGSPLGIICNNAVWGTDIDIDVTNTMPVDGYVNVLIDWNQDGQWQNDPLTQCAGVVTPEHVLVDYIVPAGFAGNLAGFMAANTSFQIGPNSGYVWVRFSITESPVGNDWDGSGVFEDGETEDYLLYVEEEPEELDFGDADETGTSFPTTLFNDGARHTIVPNYCLGTAIDGEPDGLPDPAAMGDDNNNLADEDGISIPTNFVTGFNNTIIDITHTKVAGDSAFLDGWADFNNDGDWDDAGERIFNKYQLSGWPLFFNSVFITIPPSAVVGANVFCRFRMSRTGGLPYSGAFDNGEVEDYYVLIVEPPDLDFGDAPDPTYPTILPAGAHHVLDGVTWLGAQVDAEPDGIPDPNALGDDNNNLPDEDGIVFNQIMTGSPAQVNVTTSAAGYLSGWMDFDGNGSWDAAEQIFYDVYIHFAGTICLNYYVPANAVTGLTFARFRFSTVGGLGVTGPAPDGEVEDYQVEIIEDYYVKWSQQPCEYLPGLHCHDYIDSDADITIADDWLCNGGLVTDIHWWGNYELVNSGISHFHLSIHANDPDTCLPLDPELWGIDVPLALTNETNTGLLSSDLKMIYSYDFNLILNGIDPFPQEEGSYYWLDISAHSNVPTNYAVWRWQESSRSVAPILCPASYRTPPIAWQWFDWVTPAPTRYSDMAFEITSCPPSAPVNFTISEDGVNITLDWDPDPCSLYYNVYSSTDPYATFPGGWTLEPTGIKITTTTWNDPLPAGSKKFYRVTAEN